MALNWEAIKTEYITTDTSLSKLAKKYGVPKQTIGKRSSAEGWVEQRRRYVDETLTKTLQKSQERDVKRLDKLMQITGRLIDITLDTVLDEQQFNKYVVNEGIGDGMSETTEKVFTKVDTRALKDATAVLKELTGMMRDFYDLPTAAQREQREINLARLEIERKKAEQETTEDKEIRVVLPPELMELAD